MFVNKCGTANEQIKVGTVDNNNIPIMTCPVKSELAKA